VDRTLDHSLVIAQTSAGGGGENYTCETIVKAK
jgi:hypothetical protein